MLKKGKKRDAFTLLEVIIAVVLISIVIMALLQMYSNNTHIFSSLKKQTTINQYGSLLLANKNYGYEDKKISLDTLVETFDLRDELRQELKGYQVNISYVELDRIDLSEQVNDEQQTQSQTMVIEVGKTLMQTKESSLALIRLKI